jgi:secreted PhoX family phosphatase
MRNFTILLIYVLSAITSLQAQLRFTPIDTAFNQKKILIPVELRYQVIFSEDDTVVTASGAKAPAKGNHDYNAYMPINGSSTSGLLYVGHETNAMSDVLGDGGGATLVRIEKQKNGWVNLGPNANIDFAGVGGTYDNCSGAITDKGTILSAEEFPPASNVELYKNGKGTRDTSDINGLKRWQNMGWIVEVDPVSKKALHKIYGMGRFSHEGVCVMPDKKTVYLTDDDVPSVFFKYVCDKENEFTKGQLYAYKQALDGKSGMWIPLPMHRDSLVKIREVALRKGATIFARMEWITQVNGKLYITETGSDRFNLMKELKWGAVPAAHILPAWKGSGFEYPYGSLMQFDPGTNEMKVIIAGGKGIKFPDKHFSNPDGITWCKFKNRNYLVINEDIVGTDKDRTNEYGARNKKYTNEIWWLDLSIANPTVDDLQRFLVAPAGAETTGGYFTPDYSTYFVNIQHPDADNEPPFNKSVTISITGFKK